jgi:hypothetical protein
MLYALATALALQLIGCGDPEEFHMPAQCPDMGPRSVLIVDCGDGRGVCRGSSGEVLFSECEFYEGNGVYTYCVESCQ